MSADFPTAELPTTNTLAVTFLIYINYLKKLE
jgi:hypothetical protein